MLVHATVYQEVESSESKECEGFLSFIHRSGNRLDWLDSQNSRDW